VRFLNSRADDVSLSAGDRADYVRILEAFRKYISSSDKYFDHRQVPTQLRFENWTNTLGESWSAPVDGGCGH
jgi:hypothetical protein